VPFVFSEETGRKIRPVLVISSARYNRSRQDLVVAAITSNVRRRLFGDYVVAEWASAGLLLPSVVTGILRTIKQTMVERRLGRMADTEMQTFGRLLRRALAL
jgi:mRNA interferase MazF